MGERAIQISRSLENEYYNMNDTINGIDYDSISIGNSIENLAESITAPVSISQKLDSIIVLLNRQIELLDKVQSKH